MHALRQLRNQDQAAFAVGLQMWAEVVVLLLAIAAFLFLGSLVARRLRAANKVFQFVGICVYMHIIHDCMYVCIYTCT